MSPHGPRMVGRSSIAGLPEPKERLAEGLRALKGLGPYLWPRDSVELRARVVLALALLVAGKLINITVPLFYKAAVDALSGPGAAAAGLIAVPIGVILAYGLARVLSQGAEAARDREVDQSHLALSGRAREITACSGDPTWCRKLPSTCQFAAAGSS